MAVTVERKETYLSQRARGTAWDSGTRKVGLGVTLRFDAEFAFGASWAGSPVSEIERFQIVAKLLTEITAFEG